MHTVIVTTITLDVIMMILVIIVIAVVIAVIVVAIVRPKNNTMLMVTTVRMTRITAMIVVRHLHSDEKISCEKDKADKDN